MTDFLVHSQFLDDVGDGTGSTDARQIGDFRVTVPPGNRLAIHGASAIVTFTSTGQTTQDPGDYGGLIGGINPSTPILVEVRKAGGGPFLRIDGSSAGDPFPLAFPPITAFGQWEILGAVVTRNSAPNGDVAQDLAFLDFDRTFGGPLILDPGMTLSVEMQEDITASNLTHQFVIYGVNRRRDFLGDKLGPV